MPTERRLLVVSHPAVLAVNQEVYGALVDLGWDVQLVVPDRWTSDFDGRSVSPQVHPRLEGRVHPLPVVGAGLVQRHAYRTDTVAVLRRHRPDLVFLEEEYYSVPAAQWGLACRRIGLPFGVQADENLDRPLPGPARALRALTLHTATFVVARTPTAGRLARRLGGPALGGIVPHAVPDWPPPPPRVDPVFTVGFAGRLVDAKGIDDLVGAVGRLEPPVRLLVAGDGPRRDDLCTAELPAPGVDLRSALGHDGMPTAYAEMDVLVLPSRTTETWAEQFGRVLVEALSFGVPVIGSDSGEIPWVVEQTGGGVVVPEGDVEALTEALRDVCARPEVWRSRGEAGRRVVAERFAAPAAAAQLDRLLQRVLRVAPEG